MSLNIEPVYEEYTGLVNATDTHVLATQFTDRPHLFLSAEFLDASGAVVTPGAGTLTYAVHTKVNPNVFEAITNGTSVDATAALDTLSVAANVTKVVFSSESITTGVTYVLRVMANRS